MRYQNHSRALRQPPAPWRTKLVPRKESTSARLNAVYAAILHYAGEHAGATPTLRELMHICNISSTSVAAYQVQTLILQGKLTVKDRKLIVAGSRWLPPGLE